MIGVGATGPFCRMEADVTIGRMIQGTGVTVLFGGCFGEAACCSRILTPGSPLLLPCSSCPVLEREDSGRSGLAGAVPLGPVFELSADVEDSVIAGLAGMGAAPLKPDFILVNSIVVFGMATDLAGRWAAGIGIRLTTGCIFRVGSSDDEDEGELNFCGVPQILQKRASAASSFLHLGQRFIFYASGHVL
jgi:hypothetical protein